MRDYAIVSWTTGPWPRRGSRARRPTRAARVEFGKLWLMSRAEGDLETPDEELLVRVRAHDAGRRWRVGRARRPFLERNIAPHPPVSRVPQRQVRRSITRGGGPARHHPSGFPRCGRPRPDRYREQPSWSHIRRHRARRMGPWRPRHRRHAIDSLVLPVSRAPLPSLPPSSFHLPPHSCARRSVCPIPA